MNHDQLKFRIGLTLIHGIGNNLAKNLIAYLGNEEAVFKEKALTLAKVPGIGKTLALEIANHQHVLDRAEKEIEFMSKNGVECCYYADDEYPHRLRECFDAPLILYKRCNHDLNQGRFIGVVGTRNATEQGKENCRKLIAELKNIDNTVIMSGLAYGIDICSHKAALENNIPTIGVIAHGLDRIYPGAHLGVARRMTENGGLITEYLSETNPDRQNFVQRNRIIAGMSDVVIVVESGQKGGALITAELANDYNREVLAFPGRNTDEWSKGCNSLIKRNKAMLIESAADLVQLMGWEKTANSKKPKQIQLFHELSPEEQKVVGILQQNDSGLQVNEMVHLSSLSYHKLSSLLLELEFKSIIKLLPGGVYKLN
jgi:DNA processing protein